MLMGRGDALGLGGVGLGALATSPLLVGNPMVAAGLVGAAAGASWLTWSRIKHKLLKHDMSSREGFVLPSDPAFGEHMLKDGTRMGYTKDGNMPVDVLDMFMMRHLAVIGQSGVGKTTFGEFALWQQMVRGGGFIFIDAKLDKETRDRLAYMAQLLGRGHELYVINVDDPTTSHTYNPLIRGDADEVASRLMNLVPSSESSPGSDHYRQAANSALTVLIGALQTAGVRFHFTDLAILLQSGAALDRVIRLVPEGKAKMNLQVYLDQYRKKTKEGTQLDLEKLKTTLGGMSGRIGQFAQGKFGQVFNTYAPEVDLTDIVLGNKMLYIMLPTMAKDTAALNLGKMIISDLRTAVYNVQSKAVADRPNPPFMVFADEFGSYVMQGASTLFEQARSAHICMVPAFQSFANLTTVSPDFSERIIQNTWNKIFFKFGAAEAAEVAADLIGQTVKYTRTVSSSTGSGESAQNLRATPQGSASDNNGLGESWKESEVYRVTPDQLMCMGMGEAIVISGPKVFHISVPKLNFPSGMPTFRPVRHPVSVPHGITCLRLEESYADLLLDGGSKPKDKGSRGGEGTAPAVSVPDPEDPIPELVY